MVYDYVITLKKPNYRFVDQVSLLMLFFAVAVFGYSYYMHLKTGINYLIFGVLVLLTSLFSFLKKSRTGSSYFRWPLLIAAVGWLALHNIWMAILFAAAGLLERQVKFPQEIGFSEKEIAFNSFPKKKLQWNEVSNAVIKDGLITIDQKNNKLFQKEIDSGVSPAVEKEFNEFCRRHLDKGLTLADDNDEKLTIDR
jgi:hypothetical protein